MMNSQNKAAAGKTRRWGGRLTLALLLTVAASAAHAQDAATDPSAYSVEAGQKVFTSPSLCSGCHGEHGEGDVGPVLVGSAAAQDPKTLINRILYGGNEMPGFADQLSDVQIAAVVNYVRNGLNSYPGTVDPATVKSVRH